MGQATAHWGHVTHMLGPHGMQIVAKVGRDLAVYTICKQDMAVYARKKQECKSIHQCKQDTAINSSKSSIQ